jgi:formate hydrogenlyase subunit 3/multisubunit Na+/H+ antiporter MnhD subunit
VKLGLVGLGSWLLWSHRERPAAVIAIFVAFFAYYLVLLYHLQYAATLVRSLL